MPFHLRASRLRRDRLSAGIRTFRYHSKPVPAGISRPVVTFSFSPRRVWRFGPDFLESDATRAIGQTIGQHHAHLIPKGLPGAGNLLVFDNGGSSGYGEPSGIAPRGTGVYGLLQRERTRARSRWIR